MGLPQVSQEKDLQPAPELPQLAGNALVPAISSSIRATV